jgi:hypothetical protein
MFVRMLAAGAALALAATSSALAQGAKPLRTLTFDVAYSVVSSLTARNNGLGSGGLDVASGSGFESHGFAQDDKGTVRVDVVAATADGGLVVDASFSGEKVRQPPVRIAILGDGRLAYDPKLVLPPELTELLPMLSRGLLTGHDATVGTAWSATAPEPWTGTRRFRVSAANDTTATFAIDTDFSIKGSQGYEQHDEGSLTYQKTVLAPLRYDTRIRIRRKGLRGDELNDLHLTATLTSDSFVPK